MKLLAITLTLFISLSGCSLKQASISALKSEPVQPWEKDILARQDMQLEPDPMRSYIDEHIYFSKEAAMGGKSVGGSGCGCN